MSVFLFADLPREGRLDGHLARGLGLREMVLLHVDGLASMSRVSRASFPAVGFRSVLSRHRHHQSVLYSVVWCLVGDCLLSAVSLRISVPSYCLT